MATGLKRLIEKVSLIYYLNFIQEIHLNLKTVPVLLIL